MLKSKLVLALASLLVLGQFAQAETKVVDLNQTEIQAMISVFNRLGVKGSQTHGVCY